VSFLVCAYFSATARPAAPCARDGVGRCPLPMSLLVRVAQELQCGRAKVKQKVQNDRAKKCMVVEKKLKKKQDGRAKKCKAVEHKLNKNCKTVEQKNVRCGRAKN
jgi:hypothetical protein